MSKTVDTAALVAALAHIREASEEHECDCFFGFRVVEMLNELESILGIEHAETEREAQLRVPVLFGWES